MSSVGRNDPCPCGSGKKHKRCCALKREKAGTTAMKLLLGLLLLAAAGLVGAFRAREPGDVPTRVWSPEHGHWHDVGTPAGAPAGSTQAPPPPGPAPPGKVWSAEHGHWHDVP